MTLCVTTRTEHSSREMSSFESVRASAQSALIKQAGSVCFGLLEDKQLMKKTPENDKNKQMKISSSYACKPRFATNANKMISTTRKNIRNKI